MLEHMGFRWGYVFLRAATNLDADGLHELMVQAVEMFLAGEEERQVKGGGFEGKLRTEMRYEIIGSLGVKGSTQTWKQPMAATLPLSWSASKPRGWVRSFLGIKSPR